MSEIRERAQWLVNMLREKHNQTCGESLAIKITTDLLAEVEQLEKDQCDRCVMTRRGPSRLRLDNPPIGRTWCELEDGSSVGSYEALLYEEAWTQAARECVEAIELIPTTVSVHATSHDAKIATQTKEWVAREVKAHFGLDG